MPSLKLKNILSIDGSSTSLTLDGPRDQEIDGENKLTLLPSLIDPHVHFRVPGQEYKEDYKSGAEAALHGGTTRVFDMPNNIPPITTLERLNEKIRLIDAELKEIGIPLRYNLFFGASNDNRDEIIKTRKKTIGLKVYMGSSTNGLLVDNETALRDIFQIAAREDIVVALHAEDEATIKENEKKFTGTAPETHSRIRSREAAAIATKKAIDIALDYSTQIYFCHVSTKDELDLIIHAKKNEMLVYIEATPHHLFLTEEDYARLGTRGIVNPPLRTKEDQDALWDALKHGYIDAIGTDHAPHTLEEKSLPYPQTPSGFPGIETRLPLLLDAFSKNRITLTQIAELTRVNIERIFRLDPVQDFVLVDLNLTKQVQGLKSKCGGGSPFEGFTLKGWPVYTILRGEAYRV